MKLPTCLSQLVNAVIGNVIQKRLKEKILLLQKATIKLSVQLHISLLEKPPRENTQIVLTKQHKIIFSFKL